MYKISRNTKYRFIEKDTEEKAPEQKVHLCLQS